MILHHYFCDNAVIQADKPYLIKGVAHANTCVRAELLQGEKTVTSACSTTDENGYFEIEMLPRTASFDAYVMHVFTPFDEVYLNDILFGDVYFLTGQSNMAYTFCYQENNAKIFENENTPFVRYQKVPRGTVQNIAPYGIIGKIEPQRDYATPAPWILGNDFEKAKECSAIGYVFGLKMIKKCNRPIGLVDASYGGSSVENWYPISFQKSCKELEYYNSRLTVVDGRCRIGGIWNEIVCPLKDTAFTGMLWYQGCSNCYCEYDGLNYLTMFNGFISSLKKTFKYDFPFAVLNIHANFISDFGTAYVNEQLFECEDFYNDCICIPQYDLPRRWNNLDGDTGYHQIHPTTKYELASRTADYFYKRFILKENFATPRIENVDFLDGYALAKISGKVKVKGNRIFGFTIAGENKKYYVAKAEKISDTEVKIYHDCVKQPKFITYAFFLYNDECNLFVDDLPVAPYRTDKLTSVTDGIYAVPSQILSCNIKEFTDSHFAPSYGFSKKIKTWGTGNLHPTKNKVNVTKDGVKIKYEYRPEDFYYITAGPNQNVEGLKIPFENYHYLSVDVISDADCVVNGLLVAQTDSHRFLLAPSVKELKANVLTKVTFDLDNVGYDYWEIPFDKKNFTTFDLIFKANDKTPLTITLKHIDLHD